MPSSDAPNRVLATIVFTDAVAFSARMAKDELHTLALLKRDLEFIRSQASTYGGRVLKNTGDGLLIHFSSAGEAIECAMKVQASFAQTAESTPPEACLQHRIGIHLGDVFLTEDDVMGDGVNVAARVLTQAEPGGICFSQTVYDVVKSRLAIKATFLGPRELKNIREAVPLYQILVAAALKQQTFRTSPPMQATQIAPLGASAARSTTLAPPRGLVARHPVAMLAGVVLLVTGIGFGWGPWRDRPAAQPSAVAIAPMAPVVAAAKPAPPVPHDEVWSSDHNPVFVHLRRPEDELKDALNARPKTKEDVTKAFNDMFKTSLEAGTPIQQLDPPIVRSVQVQPGVGLQPLIGLLKNRAIEDNARVLVLAGPLKDKTVWIARANIRKAAGAP